MDDNTLAVRVENLSKHYGATHALNGVDLDVRAGEIHGLVGGNGSGKSTLIKILGGIVKASPGGRVTSGGVVVDSDAITPAVARAAHIAIVHQDLGVFRGLSVAENLATGHGYPTRPGGGIDWRELRKNAAEVLERYEIPAAPDTPLASLSQSVVTQVAIARALQGQGHIEGGLLVLDEPTSSLPAHEAELLLSTLQRFARNGKGILYVSHRLDEILTICDRLTILRDGRKLGTFSTAGLTEEELVRMMVGHDAGLEFTPTERPATAAPVLELDNIRVGPLRGVSLEVHPGEVLGIAGLLGSGRSSLLKAIFGALEVAGGSMSFEGEPLRPRRPGDAIRRGIVMIPEDRAADGAFATMSVRANMLAPRMLSFWRNGRLDKQRMHREGEELIKQFLVKTSSADAPLSTLSGGNQQKAIIARWFSCSPKLLLMDEPTQGVDVGARAEIYGLLRDAVANGAAAIVVASDLEELSQVVDRAIVIRDGRLVVELRGELLNPHELTRYSAFDSQTVAPSCA